MSSNSKINMSKPLYVIGISCLYHDAAACLLKDGEIIAAAHEERFTRKKHDDSIPVNAVKYCLDEAGITMSDVAYVGFYEKPFLKFERILEGYMDTWPWSYNAFVHSMRTWLKEKIWSKDKIKKKLNYDGEIYFIEHHLAHNASSFLPSPFKEAAKFLEMAETIISTPSEKRSTPATRVPSAPNASKP